MLLLYRSGFGYVVRPYNAMAYVAPPCYNAAAFPYTAMYYVAMARLVAVRFPCVALLAMSLYRLGLCRVLLLCVVTRMFKPLSVVFLYTACVLFL